MDGNPAGIAGATTKKKRQGNPVSRPVSRPITRSRTKAVQATREIASGTPKMLLSQLLVLFLQRISLEVSPLSTQIAAIPQSSPLLVAASERSEKLQSGDNGKASQPFMPQSSPLSVAESEQGSTTPQAGGNGKISQLLTFAGFDVSILRCTGHT